MEQTDYSKYLPTEPPNGMIDYMKKAGMFKYEFLTYKMGYVFNPLTDRREAAAECRCGACGEVFYAERIKTEHGTFGFINPLDGTEVYTNESTLCPVCGGEVTAVHTSAIRRSERVGSEYMVSFHRVYDRLAVLTWLLEKRLFKDAHTEIDCRKYEAYVIEDRKAVRLTAWEQKYTCRVYLGEWKQLKRYYDGFGAIHKSHIFPFDENEYIGTSAENCKLAEYVRDAQETVYPISYLYLWVKHKNIENLVMQGMSEYVNECIARSNNHWGGSIFKYIGGIDFKAKKPHEMLGLTKDEFRYASEHGFDCYEIEFYLKAKEHGVKICDVKFCVAFGKYQVEHLFRYDVNIPRALRYIEKQNKKYPKQRMATVTEFADYLDMMKKLGEDLDDERIKYPQNLIRAHDTANERIVYKKNAKFREMFKRRTEELEKYVYESGDFIIRPAKSQAELIAEGKNLNHCVAGYAKSHAEGKTAIFFIRFRNSPDSSYYTLEFNEERTEVLQNRGLRNCERTDAIRTFEQEWLEYAKKITEKERKKNGKQNSGNAA